MPLSTVLLPYLSHYFPHSQSSWLCFFPPLYLQVHPAPIVDYLLCFPFFFPWPLILVYGVFAVCFLLSDCSVRCWSRFVACLGPYCVGLTWACIFESRSYLPTMYPLLFIIYAYTAYLYWIFHSNLLLYEIVIQSGYRNKWLNGIFTYSYIYIISTGTEINDYELITTHYCYGSIWK